MLSLNLPQSTDSFLANIRNVLSEDEEEKRVRAESKISKHGSVWVIEPLTFFALKYWKDRGTSPWNRRWPSRDITFHKARRSGVIYILINGNHHIQVFYSRGNTMLSEIDDEKSGRYRDVFKFAKTNPTYEKAFIFIFGPGITASSSDATLDVHKLVLSGVFRENTLPILIRLLKRGELDRFSELFEDKFFRWFMGHLDELEFTFSVLLKKASGRYPGIPIVVRNLKLCIRYFVIMKRLFHTGDFIRIKKQFGNLIVADDKDETVILVRKNDRGFGKYDANRIDKTKRGLIYYLYHAIIDGHITEDWGSVADISSLISYLFGISETKLSRYVDILGSMMITNKLVTRAWVYMREEMYMYLMMGKAGNGTELVDSVDIKRFKGWLSQLPRDVKFPSIDQALISFRNMQLNSIRFDGSEVTLYG